MDEHCGKETGFVERAGELRAWILLSDLLDGGGKICEHLNYSSCALMVVWNVFAKGP